MDFLRDRREMRQSIYKAIVFQSLLGLALNSITLYWTISPRQNYNLYFIRYG
jgi:hypothetical protein